MSKTVYRLHLIRVDKRGNASGTVEKLGWWFNARQAWSAGQDYLREHPRAWLQVVRGEGGQALDVTLD